MNTLKLKVSPSLLSADFGQLNAEIATLEKYADEFHVDVMDGHFVPNITIGAPVVKCIKSKRDLNVHLMINNPEKYVDSFVEAGADCIVVHSETAKNLPVLIKKIHALGVKAGVSIKPKTKVAAIKSVLGLVDEVLVMTVEPGFGGQKFMQKMLPKIAELRRLAPKIDIAVDGGINDKTSKLCIAAGANVLVAGSYIFKSKDRAKVIERLKS